MTRTITHSEFTAGSGEPVYVSTVHYATRAEREAGDLACQRVVAAAAFQPLPKPGEPFDAPEVPVFPGEYRAGLQFESASGDLNPQACVAGVCTPE